jgi:osmotically inducible protein OsmC
VTVPTSTGAAKALGLVMPELDALDWLAVTWASRTERPDGKTSPEGLIAEADARLPRDGTRARAQREQDTAGAPDDERRCTLDEVDGAPRITTAQHSVRARVPSLEAAELEHIVGLAADLCPVSNALRGNVEISVRSELEKD